MSSSSGEWSALRASASVRPPVIIIGLGNPILGDDGVGWQVAAQLAQRLNVEQFDRSDQFSAISGKSDEIEIDCLAVGGLALMERLIGYERAIIIDAINSGRSPRGQISYFPLEKLPDQNLGHLSSTHDTSLQNALKIGRAMGARLPARIEIVAIEAQQVYDFSEQLSPDISKCVPDAVNLVMELVR
jgi:hydrogenase maturation protease